MPIVWPFWSYSFTMLLTSWSPRYQPTAPNIFSHTTNQDVHAQPMTAMIATPNFNNDCSWYPYSGATNHLTNSMSNLSVSLEYLGGNQVHVGNGSGLAITHIGSSSITSSSNHNFRLRNLLLVPSITRNIISVSQFAEDNSVFFEFHPKFCFVKDRATSTVLLHRTLHEGLYRFDLFSASLAPSTTKPTHCHVPSIPYHANTMNVFSTSIHSLHSTSLDLWHQRLGHPPFPVVSKVVNICKPKLVNNKVNF